MHVSFDHAKRRLVRSRNLEVLVQELAVHVPFNRQRVRRIARRVQRRIGEEARVFEKGLRAENAVRARRLQALLRLRQRPYVPVSQHRNLQLLLNLSYERPVGPDVGGALLLASPPVHRNQLSPSRLHHLRVLQAGLQVVVHPDLRRDGHAQVLIQLVDQVMDRLPVVHEEGAVSSSFGDSLRASKVDVHAVAVRGDDGRRLQEHVRVVGAKLHQQRPVVDVGREDLLSVLEVLDEEPGVDHRGVRARRAVAPAELAKGELGLVHHRRHVKLGRAHRAEEVPRRELGPRGGVLGGWRRRARGLVGGHRLADVRRAPRVSAANDARRDARCDAVDER